MKKCNPEAFAKCPTSHLCGSAHDAEYADGSECDAFNKKVLKEPLTNGDCIRALSDEVLAEKLYDIWRGEVERGTDLSINWCNPGCESADCNPEKHKACILRWLQQPAAEVQK